MIRIGYYTETNFYGGGELYLKYLLDGLKRDKYSPTLFCPRQFPLDKVFPDKTNPGFKMRRIDEAIRRNVFSKILCLRGIFGRETVDLMHFNSSDCKAAVIAARFAGIPILIATYHGLPFPQKRKPTIIKRLKEFIGFLFLNRIISISQTAQKEWSRFLKVGKGKFRIIYNGIGPVGFAGSPGPGTIRGLKTGLGLKEDDLIVGINARLDPMKGHQCLIEAAPLIRKEVPSVKFLIAGEGSLLNELQTLAKNKGLQEMFLFLGFREDITQVTSIYDVTVFPSIYYENFSFAALEAMACAKPLVVSNIGGFPEMVLDGVTGLVVNPRDSQALAEAIITLLKDPAKRIKMGIMGRKRVEELFTKEKMVRETCEVYDSLWNRRLP
ncbi:MAG: glycosyltransferase family 4 protein [Candidatus Omnitrophota bacterium]